MNGVGKTAIWTAAARARDAASARPICGDSLAARFADGTDDVVVRELLGLRRPNASIVVRHRMIDDFLRAHLARSPEALVVILGAGLDTRAFRLGAGRFLEVDQPAVFEWKERRLPRSECPRPLLRLDIDFDTVPLATRLGAHATEQEVIVVAEGLLPYLEPRAVEDVFETLASTFPNHTLVADVLSRRFLERFGGELLPVLERHGMRFSTQPENPTAFFEAAGYDTVEASSPLSRIMPAARIMRWLLPDMFAGNVVCTATRRRSR